MSERWTITIWIAMSVLLAACGGGGGGNDVPDSVDISASAAEVTSNGSTTLSWNATTGCTASGAWSGSRSSTGTESAGPLNAPATFTLTCGNASDSVTVTPFSIQSDKTSAETFEPITLTASAVGTAAADSSPAVDVDVDVTGASTFSTDSTITIPGMIDGKLIKIAAPMLELFDPGAAPPATFSVRARRGTILTSNVVTISYRAITIPSARRGGPSTALDGLLKLLMESKSATRTGAEAIRPGMMADARIALGSSSLPDIQAEAILRQAFGVSALGAALPASTSKVQTKFGGTAIAGFQAIVDCYGDEFRAFPSWEEHANRDCLNEGRIAIRDQVIPGIAEIPEETSSVIAILSTGLSGSLGRFFTRRVVDAELSAEMAQGAVALSEAGLTLGFESPQQSVDYFEHRLTEIGIRKVYDHSTKNLDNVGKYILEKINAPEYFAEAVQQGPNVFMYGVENAVTSISERIAKIAENPGAYGGASIGDASPPATLPIPGGSSADVSGPTPTPVSVCSEVPDDLFASEGLTCLQYVTPFFDPKFLESTLQPILDSIPLEQILAACENPDSPACDAALDQASTAYEQLFASIRGYESGDFHCDFGYTEYSARAEKIRTCIFSQLAYSTNTCFAGSRRSPFDVGGASVCVYFSRDYLQPDGTCRQNYSRVAFLGADRCRWSTLPVSKPAAYSLNTETGARSTLEK